MTTASQGSASHTAEAFADKIFRAALGTMETFKLLRRRPPRLVRCAGGGGGDCS
jgi:hypothetical protein